TRIPSRLLLLTVTMSGLSLETIKYKWKNIQQKNPILETLMGMPQYRFCLIVIYNNNYADR
ncbi:MAG: hypothetical protein KTM48_01605, partial [Wolbachia endosymbiont of Pissodes strobi]|nr:hypothetical protein [Wolbachia endosymbiont of Pissodes strobi]